MKQIVKKEIYTCDLCGREQNSSMLDKCIACGRSYGWECKFDLRNVYSLNVCKECAEKEPIKTYLWNLWEKTWLTKRKKATARVVELKRKAPSKK